MNNLLEKFSKVEIKADNRISEEDRAFCRKHQEAYEKSGESLRRLAEQLDHMGAEQDTILGVTDRKTATQSYIAMGYNDALISTDRVWNTAEHRAQHFICNIVKYFKNRYHVELDDEEIEEHLIPAKPTEPDCRYLIRCYDKDSGSTEEERAKEKENYKKAMQDYRDALERWSEQLRGSFLRYEQILDEIFIQLGGFSFEERSVNELKQRCYDAAHSVYSGNDKFTIKNCVLSFPEDGCEFDYGDYELLSDTRTVLEGIAHFETGAFENEGNLFPFLHNTCVGTDFPDVSNSSMVECIKLYKNGRVDIKFRDALSVQEFVNQYLQKQTVA